MAITRAFTTSQLDSRVDFYYTATSGQTTFSGSDDNGSTLSYTASGKKDVYLNGTLLIESDDYVATNGTSVVLQATTQAGDIVHISVNKVMSNLVNLVDTSVDLNGNELILDADGDTSITADTDDQIDIKTGGTDRVHIDSSGNVGIGTASPSVNFHIEDTSTNAYMRIISNSSNTAGILFGDESGISQGKLYYLNGDDAMRFDTNGSERMRIDSSGRVTIASIPSFLASGSSGTNATVSANNQFSFGSTDYNTGSHYSTANSRFTCPVSGLYWFYVSLHADTDANDCRPVLRVNGADYSITVDAAQAFARTPSPSVIQLNMSIAINLSANDYVELWARAGTGSTLYYQGHSWFGGYLIG